MDCEMEVVGGTGGVEAASEALFSVACAGVRRRRRLDRFLIALPDSISEGEEGTGGRMDQ